MKWLLRMLGGLLRGVAMLGVAVVGGTARGVWQGILERLCPPPEPAHYEREAETCEQAAAEVEQRVAARGREAVREDAARPATPKPDAATLQRHRMQALSYTTTWLHHPHRPLPSLAGLPSTTAERLAAVRTRGDAEALHGALVHWLGLEGHPGWWDGPPRRRRPAPAVAHEPEPDAVAGLSM